MKQRVFLFCASLLWSLLGTAAPHDTLRVAVNGLPASLGNPFKGNGRPGTLVWTAIFDGLTRLDESGRLVPSLAESWRLTEPTRWEFRLRPGVRFANGRPFDAPAAAQVLQWLASKPGRATIIGNELRGISEVRAIAPLILQIRTTQPDPILPKRMVGAFMVEPDLWAKLGPDGFALQPIGTGPYRLTSWDAKARRAYAEINPYRWREAHITKLVFLELPEGAVRTQALLSGDVDLALIEIEALERLRDRAFPIVAAPSMSVMSLALISERGNLPGTRLPLQDVRVRRALNHAIDHETIARVLLQGYGRPASQPAPAIAFGHDPTLAPYPYDPVRARALLAEAGYPDGFHITADVQINAFPADSLIYQSMAHYLRQVGVDVTLRLITFPQYLRNLQRNEFTGDAFGTAWNSAPYNDVTRPMEMFSCNRPKPFFCDRALSQHLRDASSIIDEPQRLAAMHRLAREYHDAAPAIFLVEQVDLYAHRPGLTNVKLHNRVPVYDLIQPGDPP
ncbi:MAG: ABC transporter substrate-binding protein [Steroidobacteraceae bacterium]